jgi:hypothetical protein
MLKTFAGRIDRDFDHQDRDPAGMPHPHPSPTLQAFADEIRLE